MACPLLRRAAIKNRSKPRKTTKCSMHPHPHSTTGRSISPCWRRPTLSVCQISLLPPFPFFLGILRDLGDRPIGVRPCPAAKRLFVLETANKSSFAVLTGIDIVCVIHCESKKTRHYNIVHNFAKC